MSTHIRPYRHTDLDELLAIWERASRLAHPFLSDAYIEQGLRDITRLSIPNADIWMVSDDETVAGFVALLGNEVGALFVDPVFHGRGFGRTLMDKARSLHTTLELDVFTDNTIGRRFYDRYGFTVIGERFDSASGQHVLRLSYTYREE